MVYLRISGPGVYKQPGIHFTVLVFEMCIRDRYHSLPEKGIRFVTPLDPEYPKRLGHIYDYPMGLYVKGELPKEEIPTAAVIGARNCTFYGKQSAEYISLSLIHIYIGYHDIETGRKGTVRGI